MKTRQLILSGLVIVLLTWHQSNVAAAKSGPTDDQISSAVESVRQVDAHGIGHEAAVKAMHVLNQAEVDQIPIILEGMDGANPLVLNWLRSAVVKIAGDGSQLPREKIRAYFDDQERAPMGRLLAFDLLTENRPELAQEIVPTLLDDPSLPLRYKAVQDLVRKADQVEGGEAIGMLGLAIDKSRDVTQVIEIAGKLSEQGIAIDLRKQLGFVDAWQVVGNFDNKDESGFDIAYGPEKDLPELDRDATYEDAVDGDASWQPANTLDDLGVVDLNEIIGKVKGVIVYAEGNFESDEEQTAEIRVGCINAHKVWVNGELAMSNEIYHNGMSPDKFSAPIKLKKGDNQILIKVCQNEQTQPWAQEWQFQLRICDEQGKAFALAPKQVEAEQD